MKPRAALRCILAKLHLAIKHVVQDAPRYPAPQPPLHLSITVCRRLLQAMGKNSLPPSTIAASLGRILLSAVASNYLPLSPAPASQSRTLLSAMSYRGPHSTLSPKSTPSGKLQLTAGDNKQEPPPVPHCCASKPHLLKAMWYKAPPFNPLTQTHPIPAACQVAACCRQ